MIHRKETKPIPALLLSVILCLAVLTGCGAKTPEAIAEKTAGVLLKKAEPAGGDWVAFSLARWGGQIPQDWLDSYLDDLEARAAAGNGILNERKYTENSRAILALTALGKDPTDIAGCNLLIPLADYEQTMLQGINGAVFALLALDSGNYEIPENTAGSTQATRELYVQALLEAEHSGGGWGLKGEAETDLTAMALQALAKYRDQEAVEAAIGRGVAFLSAIQDENGGFTYFGTQTCESVCQTLIALTELGISPEDPRFVKNGNTLTDALLSFRQKDGTFAHLPEGGTDLLATEQALRALTAMIRADRGEPSVYRVK